MLLIGTVLEEIRRLAAAFSLFFCELITLLYIRVWIGMWRKVSSHIFLSTSRDKLREMCVSSRSSNVPDFHSSEERLRLPSGSGVPPATTKWSDFHTRIWTSFPSFIHIFSSRQEAWSAVNRMSTVVVFVHGGNESARAIRRYIRYFLEASHRWSGHWNSHDWHESHQDENHNTICSLRNPSRPPLVHNICTRGRTQHQEPGKYSSFSRSETLLRFIFRNYLDLNREFLQLSMNSSWITSNVGQPRPFPLRCRPRNLEGSR